MFMLVQGALYTRPQVLFSGASVLRVSLMLVSVAISETLDLLVSLYPKEVF